MKTVKILIASLVFTSTLNAQVKVFTGGNTIVGSSNSPVSGAKLQITGTTIHTTATGTVTPSFAAYIRAANGNSGTSTPDYSWNTDNTTGIFHPAVSTIGITLGNSEKFRFTGGQIWSNNSTNQAGAPEYSWNGDSNSGMYRYSNDNIAFATGGVERFRITSTGRLLSGLGGGSASSPDYAWTSDLNTGIFRPAMYTLAFANNGNESMRISNGGHLMIKSTTMDNAIVNVTASDWQAAYFKVTHANDWWGTMTIETNKPNSLNYIVKYNDTTRYYVAGAGWIYSQGNYLGSDINIKDNINTIDSAMRKINSIRGVTYKLKDEVQHPQAFGGQAKTYMGVIAQEVEAVAPQTVKTMANGTKAVCYEMLVGLLIEGMKEQSVEIAKLKSEVNNCCTKKTSSTTNRTITSENTNMISNEADNWLAQNKPNPFNKETVIEYSVIQEGKGSILIFDMNGKLLKTIPVKIPGKGSVTITANDLPAGMYYYTLVVNDNEVDTKKMILTQ